MSVNELKNSAVEINAIFDNLSDDLLEKIPPHLKDFFKQIASDNYHFEYDKTKTLDEQNLMPKTKGVLALIYRDYICNEKEKEVFIEKYNTFLRKKQQTNQLNTYTSPNISEVQIADAVGNITPSVYKDEKWYTKILNFIKNLFIKK